MPRFTAPVRDTLFVLEDVLRLQEMTGVPGFENATPDLVASIVEEAGRFSAEVLFPINQSGDLEGCKRHADGSVTTPAGFSDAYRQYCEGGWSGISDPESYGGQGLPHVVGLAVKEYVTTANQAFAMYPGLTGGAVSALVAAGSEELKATYLARMISGEWSGTMNLTEPHCGTDLGLIRTRAEPLGDGSYAITGTKIFISAGEQDLTENIIHLVLAKLPGAPEGSKGISLFLVPKVMVESDGSLGGRNSVSCGSIEEKMGIHGSATCVMNYDGAKGWLVGEENKGLAAMFIMMNAARLGVGLQGLAQAEVSYQNAVDYALERRQGRALTGPKEPDQSADPIIVHPDVRRMLMDARAFTEGMRALILWGALLVDLSHKAASEAERQAADDLIGILTPVIKGYGTDKGYDVATNMQQVYGGHGYVREWGMEQYVRDARIAMIYEGTNGVQAMDLAGRKLAANGGRAIRAFFKLVDDECAAAAPDAPYKELADRLVKANGELKAATMWFMSNAMANRDNLGAGAHPYMHIAGLVAVGLMWLRMARAAQAKLAAGEGDKAFLEAKLVTARFYAERYLPDAGALRRKIEGGAESMMSLPAAAFARG
jgi:alkylation response protein AidB-like acyl-CoA dehydrogenase